MANEPTQKATPIVKQLPQSQVDAEYTPTAPVMPGDYASTLIQLMTEFVSGGSNNFLAALKRTVPTYIDALTQELGADLYEHMMRDADVYSAVDARKNQILADGMHLEPAVKQAKPGTNPDPGQEDDAKLSQEMVDFVSDCIKNLQRHDLDLSYEMLDALWAGNKCAEKVLGDPPVYSKWKGKQWWRQVKVRNRRKLAFICDSWNNVVGFFAVEPDKAYVTIPQITILDNPLNYSNFLPRDKFMVLTHRPQDEDPRGTSILQAAYPAWIFKTQVLPQYFNNLRRWGSGTLIGTTGQHAPGLTPQVNPVTNQPEQTSMQLTAQQAMLDALLSLTDQSAAVFPFGSEVQFVQPTGEGKVFLEAMSWCSKQIAQAVLTTSRATLEAENTSQADNDSAGDVMSQSGNLYKKLLAWVWQADFVMPLIALNYPGKEHLCPVVHLTAVERQDKAALMTAYAAIGYTADESQFPGLDEELGMPPRDLEAIAARKQQESEDAIMQAKMMGAAKHPGDPGMNLPPPAQKAA